MPDPVQQPQEIHIHNDSVQSGPLAAIPAVAKTIAGIPTEKAIVWSVILGVLAVVGATLYSLLFLLPAADERRQQSSERQQQQWRDASVRSQQEEAERGRDMMRQEGALNRQSRETSDRIQAENIKALALGMGELRNEMGRLENTIKKLIDKQDESLNPATVPNRP
jgi:hypothetical protein